MTVKLKNILRVFSVMSIIFSVSCQNGRSREKLINNMSSTERKSVVFSAVSKNQKYYSEVASVAEYIQEMSVYNVSNNADRINKWN